MKKLGEGIKLLPDNLLILELKKFMFVLWGNNLGVNIDNIKFIGEGMKGLPHNL